MTSRKNVGLPLLWTALVMLTVPTSGGARAPGRSCSSFGRVGLADSTGGSASGSILAIRAAGSSGAVVLSRLEALSLKPASRQLRIGEYHDAWSLSPDRKHLALGLSRSGRRGRIGVGVVALATLKLVREVETRIAAEAVGWLAPRRLAAGLQDGRVALVDPASGKVLRSARGAGEPRQSAQAGKLLVVLLADPFVSGPARIAVADARGHVRRATLDQIRLRVHVSRGRPYADSAGLAVDPSGGRAYIVAAGAPVAVVALGAMSVSYHRVEPLLAPLAAGSILYVVIELLNVCRTFGSKVLTSWGVVLGLTLGFATDFVLHASGI